MFGKKEQEKFQSQIKHSIKDHSIKHSIKDRKRFRSRKPIKSLKERKPIKSLHRERKPTYVVNRCRSIWHYGI